MLAATSWRRKGFVRTTFSSSTLTFPAAVTGMRLFTVK
jgi:hypothetical protein